MSQRVSYSGRFCSSPGSTHPSGIAGSVPIVPTEVSKNIRRASGALNHEAKDAVAPRSEVMMSIPSISSAVSQLLAHYDDQADQGYNVRKKSGRYNVTDNSVASPQCRWPNAGLVSNSYLMLTSPWPSGSQVSLTISF